MKQNAKLVEELSAEVERTAYQQRLEVFLNSRDAGSALTLDALRSGIRLKTVIATAADVAEYADEALAIIREEYNPQLDCKENCWYCCCKPGVLISVPELLRILDYIRSTFTDVDVSQLKESARRYAEVIAGRNFNDSFSESVPCPLLVDGRCSAYEVRPLVCRGYNSTNVHACREAHHNTEMMVPIFAVIKDVTDGATVGAAQSLNAAGFSHSLVDLGSALNIALAAGDRFSETIIDGSAALVPAENSSCVDNLWAAVRETARRVGVAL